MSDETEKSPAPVDPRVRLAAERTLLAWIRTGLAMMGFGFVVARFGLFLRELAALHLAQAGTAGVGPESREPGHQFALVIGTVLVLLGAGANLVAAVEHARYLRRLERGEAEISRRWSLGIVVASVLAALGIAVTAHLWFSAR